MSFKVFLCHYFITIDMFADFYNTDSFTSHYKGRITILGLYMFSDVKDLHRLELCRCWNTTAVKLDQQKRGRFSEGHCWAVMLSGSQILYQLLIIVLFGVLLTKMLKNWKLLRGFTHDQEVLSSNFELRTSWSWCESLITRPFSVQLEIKVPYIKH